MKNIFLAPFRFIGGKIHDTINDIEKELNCENEEKREQLKERTKILCWQNKRELTPKEKEAIYNYNQVSYKLHKEFTEYTDKFMGAE